MRPRPGPACVALPCRRRPSPSGTDLKGDTTPCPEQGGCPPPLESAPGLSEKAAPSFACWPLVSDAACHPRLEGNCVQSGAQSGCVQPELPGFCCFSHCCPSGKPWRMAQLSVNYSPVKQKVPPDEFWTMRDAHLRCFLTGVWNLW